MSALQCDTCMSFKALLMTWRYHRGNEKKILCPLQYIHFLGSDFDIMETCLWGFLAALSTCCFFFYFVAELWFCISGARYLDPSIYLLICLCVFLQVFLLGSWAAPQRCLESDFTTSTGKIFVPAQPHTARDLHNANNTQLLSPLDIPAVMLQSNITGLHIICHTGSLNGEISYQEYSSNKNYLLQGQHM